MSKGSHAFIPKARLIQILGEHLIKDATVGIMELVKNAYDADATHVTIVMQKLNQEGSKIIIKDNGIGIDLETFLKKWMNPATGHKQEQKDNLDRTKLGRLPLGEKGVGRFATQQIGNNLQLISKPASTNQELYVDIDWKQFQDFKKDLRDITVNYELKPAKEFDFDTAGTILEICDLKSKWKRSDIERLSNSLKRMKSPFKGATDFDITLKFIDSPPEFKVFEDLEVSDILDKAHFKFYGIIDNNGNLDYEYNFHVPGIENRPAEGSINLIEEFAGKGKEEIKPPISCGGFYVYFNYYYRQKEWIKRSNFNPKDLTELSGVSVFRDGMRIFPYGEKGDDWLQLDSRRIQAPGVRVSNHNIIGMIEINQIENPKLKDKTNREGLIENEEYDLFKSIIVRSISIFENEMRDDRGELKTPKLKSPENIIKSLEDTRSKYKPVYDTLSKSDDKNVIKSIPELIDIEKELETNIIEVEDTIKDLNDRTDTLFNLAGTGLAAERFTHGFARMIRGSTDSLKRLKSYLDLSNQDVLKEYNLLSGLLDSLKNDIRLLGPLFYVKKVSVEKKLDLKKIIKNSIMLHDSWLNEESINIGIIGDSFDVVMREGNCMQIFTNLIDNSIYWLSKKSELDRREIRIIMQPKESTVYFTDSGPGVFPKYSEKIFDAFVTMKEEGRGLGLFIIKEILQEKNYDIYLVNRDDFPELLPGASFKIVFRDIFKQD